VIRTALIPLMLALRLVAVSADGIVDTLDGTLDRLERRFG
jgi:hypothetical protein